MLQFSEKQIKVLRGSIKQIAEKAGCSRYYASCVINGKVEIGRNADTARKVQKIALQALEVLEPIS